MLFISYINYCVIYPAHNVIVADVFWRVQKLKFALMILHADEDCCAY